MHDKPLISIPIHMIYHIITKYWVRNHDDGIDDARNIYSYPLAHSIMESCHKVGALNTLSC